MQGGNVLGRSGAFFWGRDDVCAASGDNLSSLINSIVDSTMVHAPEELLNQSAGPYAHATAGTLVTSWESTFCDVLGTDWLSTWTLQSWPTAVPFKREFVVKALESLRFALVTKYLNIRQTLLLCHMLPEPEAKKRKQAGEAQVAMHIDVPIRQDGQTVLKCFGENSSLVGQLNVCSQAKPIYLGRIFALRKFAATLWKDNMVALAVRGQLDFFEHVKRALNRKPDGFVNFAHKIIVNRALVRSSLRQTSNLNH